MSGSRSHSSSKTKDLTPEEFVGLRGPTAEGLTNLFESPESFDGPLVAGLGQGETDILRNLDSNPFGRDISQGELVDTIQGDSAGFQSLLDEALAGSRRDITDTFNDEHLENRALFGRAQGQLSQSSPFAMAQARSNEGFLNAIGDASVGIRLPAMQQERQNQLAAVGQLGQLNESNLARELSVLEAQGLPRLVEDEGITRGIDLFKEEQARVLEAMRLLTAVTQPNLGSFSSSSSSQGGICWVADVLFGEGSDKALAARKWANANQDHWFIKVYAQAGESWAEFLKANKWAHEIVAPIWEEMAVRGEAI